MYISRPYSYRQVSFANCIASPASFAETETVSVVFQMVFVSVQSKFRLHIVFKNKVAVYHTHPSVNYISFFIDLMPSNPMFPMLNVHITSKLISVGRFREASIAMLSSQNRNWPSVPSRLGLFFIMSELLSWLVRRLCMRILSRPPAPPAVL